MSQVGAYAAKTHLAQLLDRAERGERITITRHGRPVAELVPVGHTAADRSVAEAVDGLLAFRSTHRLGTELSVRDLVREGRKR